MQATKSPPLLLLLLQLALAALVGSGCGKGFVIDEPTRRARFGPVVDSVVVEPFLRGPQLATEINTSDFSEFERQLAEEVGTRPFLKTFAEPPTELPNTLILQGILTQFQVEELAGEEFSLRNIHVAVELRARTADQTSAGITIVRRLSYQKVYLPSDRIPVLAFDLHNAAKEMARLLVEAFFPEEVAGGIPLEMAVDPVTGDELGHPTLIKGNKFAVAKRFARAKRLWQVLLFSPTQRQKEPLYKVTPRTLHLLKKKGVEEGVLERLTPLTREDPEDLVEFREMLHEVMGRDADLEKLLFPLADHKKDRTHLNLAAAHGNLAILFWLDGRYDLTSYHLAKAYANYPKPKYLEKWVGIQEAREIIPDDIPQEELIGLYMRLPPPWTVGNRPGSVENGLFRPAVFRTPAAAPSTAGGRARETEAPTRAADDYQELQPVLRPPPDDEKEQEGLPPIEAPESAGAGGRTTSGG